MKKRLSVIATLVLTWSLALSPAVPVFASEGGSVFVQEGTAEEPASVTEDAPIESAPASDTTDVAEGESTQDEASAEQGDGEDTGTVNAEDTLVTEEGAGATATEPEVVPTDNQQASADGSSQDTVAVTETEAQGTPAGDEMKDAEGKEDGEAEKPDEEKAKDEVVLTAQSSVSEANDFAAKHKGAIANGTYAFTCSLGNGFAMDVRGASKANGAQVISWSTKTANNQRWIVDNVGGGFVTIKCINSGKYLQAGYGGKSYLVVQNARNANNRGQLWIACRESGSYKFVSALDLSRVLVVAGGTKAKSGYAIYSYVEKSAVTKNKLWNVSVTKDIQDAFAKAHKGDLADGIYYIASTASSSLRLSVANASLDNSARANLQGKADRTIQGWKVTHDSRGYVTIVNVQSRRSLDVRGAKAAEGTSIIQYTLNASGVRNQKWIAVKGSNGSYTLYSALTGAKLVLGASSASASANTRLSRPTGAATSQWTFTKAPARYAHLNDVPAGRYLVATTLNKSKVLDVAGSSKKSGVGVKLWSSKDASNQIWDLSYDAAGYVHLKNTNSGLQLAYSGGRLVQSSKAYNWVFEKVSGGYRIQDAVSGKYLDVSRNNTDNKTNKVILYAKGSGKNQIWSVTSPTIGSNTPIMGVSQVSQAQAVRYIKNAYQRNGQSLPAKWRKDGETVEKIVKYFWEEGAAEGVRGDVALAQSIHETGMFQFGGDVIPAQYNFAGIGTTGGGVRGNYFKNARIGVRAQIQHLKAYASTKPLVQACVDPRFTYVDRGCAPTIAGLAGTWAIDSSYARSITYILNAMLAT